jgi:hypothetical protein
MFEMRGRMYESGGLGLMERRRFLKLFGLATVPTAITTLPALPAVPGYQWIHYPLLHEPGDLPISETLVSVATVDAYLATDYKVNTAEPFVLNVGKPSAELAKWFQTNNKDKAAYITAWNPFGEKISDDENHAAEQKLITEIESHNLCYLKGESSDPLGLWPSEPSLLVFGISLKSAKALAKRYHQDGFMYIGEDTKPQLILLR